MSIDDPEDMILLYSDSFTSAGSETSLETIGIPIGPMDLLIASISLSNNCILLSNNIKEFRRVKTLKVENWV
jgi:tRNA(fMet)-specific endonuclease VapC